MLPKSKLRIWDANDPLYFTRTPFLPKTNSSKGITSSSRMNKSNKKQRKATKKYEMQQRKATKKPTNA
jgi:hypothetical protein